MVDMTLEQALKDSTDLLKAGLASEREAALHFGFFILARALGAETSVEIIRMCEAEWKQKAEAYMRSR
jgi:hypothetical protein